MDKGGSQVSVSLRASELEYVQMEYVFFLLLFLRLNFLIRSTEASSLVVHPRLIQLAGYARLFLIQQG